jgi:hypothetical protein
MTMLKRLSLAALLLSAIIRLPLLGQTIASPSPAVVHARRLGQSCWQQAGISPSVMPQLRQIRQATHTQVESVRSDNSLTSQQKRQQVQHLRQDAYQQADVLVGSKQLEALRTCQELRAGNDGGMHRATAYGSTTSDTGQQP